MPTDVSTLQVIGDLDQQIRFLTRDIDKANRKMSDASGQLEAAQRAQQAAEDAITENRNLERAAQRKLDQYDRQKRSALTVLEQGLSSPGVAQAQIEKNDELIDEIENVILELLDLRDTLVTELGARKAEASAAEEHLGALKLDFLPKIEEWTQQRARVTAGRDVRVLDLYAEDQAIYRGMLRRKGAAIAWLVKKSCSQCRLLAPSFRIADINRGQPIRCDGCARWLVPEPVGV